MRAILPTLALAALALATFATPTFAADAQGVWIRSEGTAKVRFSPCGGALCGTVVWLKKTDGPGTVGQQVFFDMKPSGANTWSGNAFNPEDGRNYDGTMVLSGNHLKTTGCALGGMICRSVNWTRSN